MRRFIVGLFLLFFAFGCVDRLFYDVTSAGKFGLSISGHITNNGGPHRVNVFRNFDIDSKDSLKTGVSASRVTISDAEGNSAELSQIMSGIYETKENDIIGKTGGIYKLKVELEDGRIYESLPDTLPVGGTIDTAYYKYTNRRTEKNFEYEIYASSSTHADLTKTFFIWSNKMTYKAKTRPELEFTPPALGPCYRQADAPHLCNLVAPCTGLKNVGSNYAPTYQYVGPCECCICWYDQYSRYLVLSDKLGSYRGRFNDVLVDRIEQTGWNMMYKMRIEVTMQSLSLKSYRFWKAVRDQQSATTNIFQPITGKIPGNIIQTKGTSVPAEGIFYGTASNQKVFYINRGDHPIDDIPPVDGPRMGWYPCPKLAPNATTTMPLYWID